jgi:Ca-activated chloride channel family protein
MGHGLLRTRIFPINPGEKKRVVVRFDVVAEREGDALRIDYFRGGRTGAMGQDVADNRSQREGSVSFTLQYPESERWGRPFSPTHSLDIRDSGSKTRVEVDGDGREVTILMPIRRTSSAAITVLPYATGGREDGFALITVSPPTMRARTTPRDVTLVIDVSGSMSGKKMQQARDAAKEVLATLSESDRFRIIDFSTDVRSFRDNWAAANGANIREGTRYIEALEAQGSTNISGALDEALSASTEEGRMPVVLFITDGEPSVGERNPTAIAQRAAQQRGRRRVFTFGLGSDVNVQLVEQLALEGRGSAHFVRPEESVERTVALVASRLSSPIATDVRVRAEGVRLEKILPAGPVDIFAGQDLVLLARYDGNGEGTIRFEGQSADGPVSWSTTFDFPERGRENFFVPRLWATQRVGWLSAEKRRNGGNAEIDGEIRELGERFGIPTEFTSYFVKEPGMDLARVQVGNSILSGVQTSAGGTVVGRGQGGSAPPPVAAQRDAQFEAAKMSQDQRAATNLARVEERLKRIESMPGGQVTRSAGGRVFQMHNGIWTDLRMTPQMRRVKVKPYSAAYFKLLEMIPELREAFAVGEAVIVVGRAIAVEVSNGGEESLTERELESVRSNW